MSAAVVEKAKRVLRIEAQSILDLAERVDEMFLQAIDLLIRCRGKVVLMGMGKSGLVARKIASTFASTGTPAFFLHPAEGVNGDFGMLAKEDAVIAISYSGETRELIEVLSLIKRYGNRLIALTGHPTSTLAKAADVHLDIHVKEEACPLGLAPTASTTTTLALGDALAVSLMEKRGFKEEDFARLHPGGALGKRLLLRVEDVMHSGEAFPMISEGASMKEAIFEITSKRLGVTGVSNRERPTHRGHYRWRSEKGSREVRGPPEPEGRRGDDEESEMDRKGRPGGHGCSEDGGIFDHFPLRFQLGWEASLPSGLSTSMTS